MISYGVYLTVYLPKCEYVYLHSNALLQFRLKWPHKATHHPIMTPHYQIKCIRIVLIVFLMYFAGSPHLIIVFKMKLEQIC